MRNDDGRGLQNRRLLRFGGTSVDPQRRSSSRQLAGLGLASGAMLLSHLPTAVTAMPAISALMLALLHRRPATAGLRLAALGGGTLLAAPYLLGAWLSVDLVNADFLRENPLWQIEANLWLVAGSASTRSLAENAAWFRFAAYVGIALSLLAMLAIWRQRKWDAAAGLLSIAALVCSALMFRFSSAVYEAIPLLQWMQFGWRWQGVTLLLVLSLVARAFGAAAVPIAPAVGLVILLGLGTLSALGPLAKPPFWMRDRTSAIEAESAAIHCIWDTLEHRPRSMGENWRIDSRWLAQAPEVLDGRIHVLAATRSAHAREYTLQVDFPGRVRLDALAFPGWVADLDGRRVAFAVGATGLIELELPAGDHRLSLRYSAPVWVRVAEGVSLLLLGALAWVLVRRPRSGRPQAEPTRGAEGRRE